MNITIPTNSQAIQLMQCLNIILQLYSTNEDLISTIGISDGLEYPSIKIDFKKKIHPQFRLLQPDFYLIQEYDGKRLESILKNLGNVTDGSFNPRAKFVFVSNNFSEEFTSQLSSFYVLNVVFLHADKTEIFTYFPYAKSSLNTITTTLKKLGNCEDVPKTGLFPPKVPKTWKNSTLLLSYRFMDAYAMCTSCPEKGVDIDLFQIILNHANIKGEYSEIPSKTDLDFWTSSQVFIGNYGPAYGRAPFGEFSMSYTEDAVVWIVPAAGPMPRWKYFLEIFEMNVWISSLTVVGMVSITWGLAKWLIYGVSIREFLTVPISTFNIFLGQGFTFHTVLISHWILVTFIIFFSIMMNFFFATRLTYLLNGQNIEDNINSLEDAVDHKMILGCTLKLATSFNNTKKREEYLKHNYQECDASPDCVERVAEVRDMVVCRTIRRTRYLKSLVNAETGKWMVKELQSPIFVKQVAAVFRKGMPLARLFNKYIFSMVESGILKVIIEKYERRSVLNDFSAPVRKLQLEHLEAPLFLWSSGLVLAILVFTAEKLWKYGEGFMIN